VYSLIFCSDLGHHRIPSPRRSLALPSPCCLPMPARLRCERVGGGGGAAKVANWVKEIGGLEVSLPKAEL